MFGLFTRTVQLVPRPTVLIRTGQFSVRFQSTAQSKRVPRVLPSFSLEGKVSLKTLRPRKFDLFEWFKV
jgi:hypothetical protein